GRRGSLGESTRKGEKRHLHPLFPELQRVDIHPDARIGEGVLLDHATGVVIGETTEVGNDVSILQNVMLRGTG
ncbi:unnamed protein product, partial [Linum tenue]